MCKWLTEKRDESEKPRMAMMGNQVIPAAAALALRILIGMHRELCQDMFHYV